MVWKELYEIALLYQVITKFMQNIKIFVRIYGWKISNSNKSKIFSFGR